MEDFNALLLKLVLVIVTAPAWFPFLKTVWEEFNKAMAEEGGVFGPIPTPAEAERIARERRSEENPLVHLPLRTREERIAGRRRFSDQRGTPRPTTAPRDTPRARPRFR